MYTNNEYIENYTLEVFKKYIIISTAILTLLFFKYMHINPVLLFPIVLNVILFYILKYNASIKVMTHIFNLILMIAIIMSPLYITNNSFIAFLIMSLMFTFLTFSLFKLDIAIIYNIVLSSTIFIVNQNFNFISSVNNDILLFFYTFIVISALFFAVSRIFQVNNIENIRKYLESEINIQQEEINKLQHQNKQLLETIDTLKIKDNATELDNKKLE